MATFRQVSRGIMRAARAAERDARRSQRQHFLHQQALAKDAMLDASARAVDRYDSLIELLTKCHQVPFSRMDWASTAHTPIPSDPTFSDGHERAAAAAALAGYRPGWFARTFGGAATHRAKLTAECETARRKDAAAHSAACERAARKRDEIAFAQQVLTQQPDALIKAIEEHALLDGAAAEGVRISIMEDGRVIVVVDAYEHEDMPTEAVSLLKSGKASQRQITPGKIQELHRDSVCSAAVRVATEILRVTPLEAVEVLMQVDLLDRASGHITPQPVLYARITAQALQAVNLQQAEATPLAERLGALFSWTRKEGFRPLDVASLGIPATFAS